MIINLNEPFYSYDKLITDAKTLALQYDSILKYVTIGETHDNRDIILLKLGTGQNHMIVCSGVHARETVNPVVILSIIEFYAQLYVNYKGKNDLKKRFDHTAFLLRDEYEQMLFSACIYELLQTFTILFVPLLNPDGYMISLDGFEAIRNEELRQYCMDQGIPAAEWKSNARGIDLNRNFPSRLWRPKTSWDHAASENETMALISLFHDYHTLGFIDFHSRGKEIYYYRSMMPDSYNKKQLEIAARLREITGYELVMPEEEVENGDSGGNTVHYYSEHFYKPALTIETVEDEAAFPLEEKYRVPVFEELKLVIFEFGSMIIHDYRK